MISLFKPKLRLIAQRRLDELGRIVLPMEVRLANGWEAREPLDVILLPDGSVLLRNPQRKG